MNTDFHGNKLLIERKKELETLSDLLSRHPVVGIIGARQVGKTTLSRALAAATKKPVTYFDLEDPQDLTRLADPMLAFERLNRISDHRRSAAAVRLVSGTAGASRSA